MWSLIILSFGVYDQIYAVCLVPNHSFICTSFAYFYHLVNVISLSLPKVITLTGFKCTNIIHNSINIIGIVLIWLLLSFFTHTKLITLRDFHCIKQFTEFNYPLKIKWSFLQLWGKKKPSFFLCKSYLINCEIHWKIQFKSVSAVNQIREKVYWKKKWKQLKLKLKNK